MVNYSDLKSEFTSRNLLYYILDLKSLTPEIKDWSLENLGNNPPRLVRLQSMDALLTAFLPKASSKLNLAKKLKMFFDGSFILNRTLENYSEIISDIANSAGKAELLNMNEKQISLNALQRIFQNLLEFKLQSITITNFNSGVYAISYPYSFSYQLTKQVIETFMDSQNDIDKYLARLIDPEKKSFTVEYLIKNFNFPTENLAELDIDWI